MKSLQSFLIGVLILQLSFLYAEPSKHALIIAVGDYPAEGGWSPISSVNDVDLIKAALLKQGFSKDNMMVLINGEANKAGIIQQLVALSGKVNKGDIVVIHFSGHGQQIMDNDRDELDGYDESLIPYDANLYFSKTYKGENHLRDDEMTSLLNALRIKLGDEGNVLVILDSCHSGTGTRGLAKSRGTEIKFQSEDYNPSVQNDEDNFSEMGSDGEPGSSASMVVLSGASQEELNYEYIDRSSGASYGSLSYSFSKALAKATPSTTYRALFDMIKVEMNKIAPRQSPQIEGDVDMEIFGGQAVDQKPYFMIADWLDEKTFTIHAGNLMGIYDGTEVGFYDINTSDPTKANPKAIGHIINSSAIESDIILDGSLTEDDAKNAWVFVTKQNFGDLSIKVKIGNLKDKQLTNLLSSKCEELPTVQIVKKDPELIIERTKHEGTDYLQIITIDELIVKKIDLNIGTPEDVSDAVVQRLKGYVQANLLKNVNMSDRDLNVTFEIIPVTVKRSGSRYVVDQQLPIESKIKNGNQLVFEDGDPFRIIVKNDGYTPAYYQLIDIQPDNNIGILIPGQNRTAAEYIIYPGEEKELPEIFVFGEPYGTEIFKMVATREPIDLSMIVSTRGARDEGYKSPFEKLFAETYSQTRAGTLSMPPSSINVFTIPFKVVAKGE